MFIFLPWAGCTIAIVLCVILFLICIRFSPIILGFGFAVLIILASSFWKAILMSLFCILMASMVIAWLLLRIVDERKFFAWVSALLTWLLLSVGIGMSFSCSWYSDSGAPSYPVIPSYTDDSQLFKKNMEQFNKELEIYNTEKANFRERVDIMGDIAKFPTEAGLVWAGITLLCLIFESPKEENIPPQFRQS